MEIRIIRDEELENVAGLSRLVFDKCLRNRMEFTQTIPFVENYLQVENLKNLCQEEKLVIWGAFEQGQMVGVSGLESDGMITMLYVLPHLFNKGIGRQLLEKMRVYAKEAYGLEKVLVNATPAWTAFYFVKQGFSYLQPNQNMRVPFVSLYALSKQIGLITNRRIPKRYMILALIGCILFATVAASLFMISYL